MLALTASRRPGAGRIAPADLIVVVVPLLVGGLLCAIELNTRSLWLDEGATYAITSQHGAALWHGIGHDGGNMLLYYLLEHVVGSLFGHAAWVMRLPSLVADAVTGALVSALGLRLLCDRRQALAAGLLTVVSLPLVYWGQNARGYALMVTLATASMLAFVVLVAPERASVTLGEKPFARNGFSPRVTLAYILTTSGALYVGYDAALLIPAQLVLLLIFRERARVVLGSLAAVIVICIPLLALAVHRGSGQLFWVPPLSGSMLGETGLTLLSAGLPPSFHHTATTTTTTVVTALLLVLALVLVGREWYRSDDRGSQWRLWLVVSWLIVPAMIAVVAYAAGEPIELARCAILVMPALSLLIVWFLWHRSLPRVLGLALLAAVLVLRLLQVVPSYGTSPENWKAATAYVVGAARVQPACVIFYPQDGREVFDYYLQRTASTLDARLTPVLPAVAWGDVKPFVEDYGSLDDSHLAGDSVRCADVYLIASHIGQSSGPPVSREHLQRYQLLQARLAQLYPHSSQRSFGWAGPVAVTRYSRP